MWDLPWPQSDSGRTLPGDKSDIHPRAGYGRLLPVMNILRIPANQSFVRLHVVSLVLALFACLLCLFASASAQAPSPNSPAIEARAKALLGKLTLEEKIKLIGGVDD